MAFPLFPAYMGICRNLALTLQFEIRQNDKGSRHKDGNPLKSPKEKAT